MLRTIGIPVLALALGVLIGVIVPSHASQPSGTCETQDGRQVDLGSVDNGSICTNLVPGGWAVAAPQEVSNGDSNN